MKNMKYILTALIAFVVALSLVTPNTSASSVLTDVAAKNSHKTNIEKVYNAGIMKEASAGKFAPNAVATRADVAAALHALLGESLPKKNATITLLDVAKKDKNYNSLVWAYERGVLTATNQKINANKALTRIEVAKIFTNAMNLKAKSTVTAKDVTSSADKTAMTAFVSNGYTTLTNGKFTPKSKVTRAQLATFLVKTGKVNAKPSEVTPVTPPVTDNSGVPSGYQNWVSYESQYTFKWYAKPEEKSIHLYGIKDGKVVGEYVRGAGQSLHGIKVGDTLSQVTSKLGKPTERINYKDASLIGTDTNYYKIYEKDGNYIRVYFDLHKNGIVSTIESVKVAEVNNSNYRVNPTESYRESEERLMAYLISQTRKENGVHGITEGPAKFKFVPRNHSKELDATGQLSHIGLDGRTPNQRLHDAGVIENVYDRSGENVALSARSVLETHELFMKSTTGHRENILKADYNYVLIGIEYSKKMDTLAYYTINFYK